MNEILEIISAENVTIECSDQNAEFTVQITEAGPRGKGLEFEWDGNQLGIRLEGDTSFAFHNLNPVDLYYVHDQITSSMAWLIVHNLNKYPSVTVVDSAGSMVFGEVEYINLNSLRVSFAAEFSGKAYLN